MIFVAMWAEQFTKQKKGYKTMNFNNFTIKAQEAVQEAVNLVQQMGQQTIEPAHLMAGVLKVGENVTNFLFQKLGISAQNFQNMVMSEAQSKPR